MRSRLVSPPIWCGCASMTGYRWRGRPGGRAPGSREGRALLGAGGGRPAVARGQFLAWPRPRDRCPPASPRPARHRGPDRGAAPLRLSRDAEAADAPRRIVAGLLRRCGDARRAHRRLPDCRRSRSPTSPASWRCGKRRPARRCTPSPMPASQHSMRTARRLIRRSRHAGARPAFRRRKRRTCGAGATLTYSTRSASTRRSRAG